MTSTPNQLLAVAESIFIGSKTECMHRAVISRAYYSTFHACKEYHVKLPRPGSVGTASGMHNQLISQLATPDPKLSIDAKLSSIALGKLLRSLCAQRVKSDYRILETVTQDETKRAIETARTIFSNIPA
ncbi:MAG: HEPN domain-containing protein [Oxalobacteraceae bacterium]|nr:HEPN domain-containing protein [Oxalobacteraceae bacterium]